jgi:hypothetical protein
MREPPWKATVEVSARRFFRAVRNCELELLQLMSESGDQFNYLTEEGRNALAYCAVTANKRAFLFFRDNLDLDERHPALKQEDIYGRKAEFYVKERGWRLDEEESEVTSGQGE